MADFPKVGILVNKYPIASETFISEQAASLVQYQPIVIARQTGDLNIASRSLEVWGADEGRTGPLKKHLSSFGFPSAWGVSRLRKLSLLHAHFGTNGVVSEGLSRRLGIPNITTFHGFDATVTRSYLLTNHGWQGRMYLARLPRFVDAESPVIAVSKFLKTRLMALGFSESRINQIYIGIDTTRFLPARLSSDHAALDSKALKYLTIVGRLVPEKGIDTALKAFSIARKAGLNMRLEIFGDGPYRASLEALSRDFGCSDDVHFFGPASQDMIIKAYQRSSLALLLSRQADSGWTEAFGLAAIEAASCGVPIIVSNSGGLPETCIDGDTGYIMRPDDAEGIAERIIAILRDPECGKAMGSRGRKLVASTFDIRTQSAELENLYHTILGRARAEK